MACWQIDCYVCHVYMMAYCRDHATTTQLNKVHQLAITFLSTVTFHRSAFDKINQLTQQQQRNPLTSTAIQQHSVQNDAKFRSKR
jgi:hypothetical protein